MKVGTLIHWRGSVGVIIDRAWEQGDGQTPEEWILVQWHDAPEPMWEEWETNRDLFQIIG